MNATVRAMVCDSAHLAFKLHATNVVAVEDKVLQRLRQI